jgi:serine/threonine protein phosphatase PrpC
LIETFRNIDEII